VYFFYIGLHQLYTMKRIKKLAKIILSFFSILLIISLFLFTTVDRTPYKETDFYKKNQKILANFEKNYILSTADTLRASWAKTSLIPPFSVPMSGYSYRKGKHFEGIADSLWVRAFVFDDGKQKIALVTADLLIFPPSVREKLRKELPKIGFFLEQLFLTSTHTHCSIGAWGDTFAGEQIAGNYDEKVVDFITKAILNAIKEANKTLKIAKIGYGQANAKEYIKNRLVDEKGDVDSLFRWIEIEKESGEKAIFCTFAAHATCRGADFMQLSGDYPNLLIEELEKKVNFVAYSAGAVASQTCAGAEKGREEQLKFVAEGLAKKYTKTENIYTKNIQNFQIPLPLREPQFRIHKDLKVRDYLFNKLVGSDSVYLSFLKIGNIVLAGMPCDFSGELVQNIDNQGFNVLITSFNGGYVGYITADQWYDLEAYETLTMNWYGIGNGAYFTESINSILKTLKNQEQ